MPSVPVGIWEPRNISAAHGSREVWVLLVSWVSPNRRLGTLHKLIVASSRGVRWPLMKYAVNERHFPMQLKEPEALSCTILDLWLTFLLKHISRALRENTLACWSGAWSKRRTMCCVAAPYYFMFYFEENLLQLACCWSLQSANTGSRVVLIGRGPVSSWWRIIFFLKILNMI